ncbi:1,2-phenylacetyl-CoA epoxidase subunit PaaC [Henriciella mobilis]|uniref:Phenylacetate-CoA oxygenase subunit PaaI n=1 Tax=Henriciella mobilis TaxID=2305467 RepID=A0A399RQT2_9PROT|nr:1,2-phenylacetyl-CoA epoxidase subunit PaaC [Henriciella mobilis]RIJ32713.1 phenylacetate-CoA oxygenase subunit PaaI [Henriciella mobilis]
MTEAVLSTDQLTQYLLRLGDDSLVLGQRLSEWCGHAPSIELDLSLANVALDLIGQATLLLNAAGEAEGQGRDADALAFGRDVMSFRNCLLVEQPNGDFGQTIARQFLFSSYQFALFRHLTASSNTAVAEICAKAVKETEYHLQLASDWVVRLGDGTDESRERLVAGFDWHWRFVGEMFEDDALSEAVAAADIGVLPSTLKSEFDSRLEAVFNDAGLEIPELPRSITGGREGHHSEHLGHLLAVMQHIPRTYPGAVW